MTSDKDNKNASESMDAAKKTVDKMMDRNMNEMENEMVNDMMDENIAEDMELKMDPSLEENDTTHDAEKNSDSKKHGKDKNKGKDTEKVNHAKEIEMLKQTLEEAEKKNTEYLDLLQRKAAEFDNFRKRTTKEKESLYACSICDTIAAITPVIDSFERALSAVENHEIQNDKSFKDGILMVYRQLMDALDNLGVKPIESLDQPFNPEYHNAVMHIEDDNYGENIVIEEFQKGYIYKEEIVIRHSMVKVAN